MIVFYSNHALRRMLERGISINSVETTLLKPDKTENEQDQKKVIKKIGEKALVVIYRETTEGPFVITAYITSKLNRFF